MKRTGSERETGCRGVLTAYWGEGGLTLAMWDGLSRGRRVCRREKAMESGEVDPCSYRRALEEVIGEKRWRRLEVRWLILTEAHPGIWSGGSGGGRAVRLPDWIWTCWNRMEPRDYPGAILSASVLMEAELMDWPEFRNPGTGICLTLGEKRFFLGHGNGAWLKRLSRGYGSGREHLEADWLRQTRALFRNRTGQDLKRLYVDETAGIGDRVAAELPFEIIRVTRPTAPISGLEEVLDVNIRFLHASAARRNIPPSSGIDFPEIRARRSLHLWERRFRLAACGLLFGWGFLAFGACHHEVRGPAEGRPSGRELGNLRQELEGRQRAHADMLLRAGRREQPFRVIGHISSTMPEGVELGRIRLSGGKTGGSGLLDLQLEGRISALDPSRIFHDWMHELRSVEVLETVENLEFRREKRDIRFTLLGQLAGEGRRR
ncbi:MAG: hypothetical protein R6V45_06610 [Oceanipulchritudo sp.]